MSGGLLKTKLFAPQLRRSLVPRSHLFQRLNAGLEPEARLIVVSAPAGFGKTTTVLSWLQTIQCPAAWLALDENDNRLERFLAYLIAALQTIYPAAGKHAGELLAPPRPVQSIEVLNSLINDLAGEVCSGLLVLDDYHLISETGIHAALEYLLDNLPAALRIVLLTRQDPPLPLARLRARSQLIEVRALDLRFRLDEAGQFLNEVMALDLPAAQIAALEERTEGWAVGLQMAAISLQQSEDRALFVSSFSGSHRFILDYLVEEVLDRQPEHIRQFLLQTSVLKRLCSSLCEALTANPQSPAILAELEKRNLFLIPLDNERHWYRYHHLFADLLQARLIEHNPDEARALHIRAARWFEANASAKEAIEHAFLAHNPEYAAQLIASNIHTWWAMADLEFIPYIRRLPEEVIRRYPDICVIQAWMHIVLGAIDTIEKPLQMAEQAILTGGSLTERRGPAGFIAAMRAYLAELSGQEPEITPAIFDALDFIPPVNIAMRNSLEVMLGMLICRTGDLERGERYFQNAVQREIEAQTTNAIPIAISRQAMALHARGKIHEAAGLCREAIAHIQAHGAWRYYIAGNLYATLGLILMEWNELDEAARVIGEGLRLNLSWQMPQGLALNYLSLMQLQLNRNELQLAQQTARQYEQIQENTRIFSDLVEPFTAAKIRLWLAQDHLDAVERWASTAALSGLDRIDFRHERDHLTLARAWIALGDKQRAASLLQLHAREAERAGRTGRLIEILLLLALSAPKGSQQALEWMRKSLAYAETPGLVRTFLNEGRPAGDLIAALARQHTGSAPSRKYLAHLLAACADPGATGIPPDGNKMHAAGLIETLTAREIEILHLIAEGRSNQDIAHSLFLSPGTVKVHLSNIYRKLDCNSRTAAVARARQVGMLIDPPF